MGGANSVRVGRIAAGFNESQPEFVVVPSYKDTLVHGAIEGGVDLIVGLNGIHAFDSRQTLTVSFPSEMIHLVDVKFEARI